MEMKCRKMFMSTKINDKIYDKDQVRLLKEMIILVDKEDKIIGKESKRNAHLKVNIENELLHRAFSVFLFNSQNQLLLQQRSSFKITFPNLWTNTCCSHPLYNDTETEESEYKGIKLACQRKIKQELGIQLNIDDLVFINRIYYKAYSDEIWGEHEIDYVFFIKANVEMEINKNEVQRVKYVNIEELNEMIDKNGYKAFTPWFMLMFRSFLPDWWKLFDKSGLQNITRNDKIIEF